MDLEIHGDSTDYEVITDSCKAIQGIKGITCEIGLRMGLGSKLIMETLTELHDKRTHIAIDPYGNIDYSDKSGVHKSDYTNNMKNACLSLLHNWAYENEYNLSCFILEDTEFFERFKSGLPIYLDNKIITNDYALVHVDGPHDVKSVINTIDFFISPINDSGKSRLVPNGIIIFDDVDQYDHDSQVEPILFEKGLTLLFGTPRKKAYRK